MPWLFNEDEALLQKLSGIKIFDPSAPLDPDNPEAPNLDVAVRFRVPENELANMTYPAIIIDQPVLNPAQDREHRGYVRLPYIPEGIDRDSVQTWDRQDGEYYNWNPGTDDLRESPFVSDYPIPFNLDYQITLYARFNAHIVQLVGLLATIDYLPIRFGYLDVERDMTVRSLDVIGSTEIIGTRDGNDKRLFQAVYAVRVATELSMYGIGQLSKPVETVDLDVRQASIEKIRQENDAV